MPLPDSQPQDTSTSVPDTVAVEVSQPDVAGIDVRSDDAPSDGPRVDVAIVDSGASVEASPRDSALDVVNDGITVIDGAFEDSSIDVAEQPGDAPQPDAVDDVSSILDALDDASCGPSCPSGTGRVPILGRCDVYCAQPCSSGESKCFGGGLQCVSGFCVPRCLATPCAACHRCNLVVGTCFEDETCSDAGPLPIEDASSVVDSPILIVPRDAAAAPDVTTLDAEPPAILGGPAEIPASTDDGGCGCHVPGREGTTRDVSWGWGSLLAGLGLFVMGRRRQRLSERGCGTPRTGR